MRRFRIDTGINVSPLEVLDAPEAGAAGALLCNGIVACEAVYEYPQYDDSGKVVSIRRELVTHEALFGDSVRTLARAPVTLGHPDEMVTPENIDVLGVGDADSTVEEKTIEKRGGYAAVRLAIRKADAIAAVKSEDGPKQLSPGYWVEYDETPGEWTAPDGSVIAFDAKQIKREYNHIAIVDAARGGDACAIRMDGSVGRPATGKPKSDTKVRPLIPIQMFEMIARVDGLVKQLKQSDARRRAYDTWWNAQSAVFGEIERIAGLDGAEREAAVKAFTDEYPQAVKIMTDSISALLSEVVKLPESTSLDVDTVVRGVVDGVKAALKPEAKDDAAPDYAGYYKRRLAIDKAASAIGVEVGDDVGATAKAILDKLGVESGKPNDVDVALAVSAAMTKNTSAPLIPTKDANDDPALRPPDHSRTYVQRKN